MITRSGGEFEDRRKRRFAGRDGFHLKLGVQIDLLDQRVAQVGVVVHDQYSPRLGHLGTLPTALPRR